MLGGGVADHLSRCEGHLLGCLLVSEAEHVSVVDALLSSTVHILSHQVLLVLYSLISVFEHIHQPLIRLGLSLCVGYCQRSLDFAAASESTLLVALL